MNTSSKTNEPQARYVIYIRTATVEPDTATQRQHICEVHGARCQAAAVQQLGANAMHVDTFVDLGVGCGPGSPLGKGWLKMMRGAKDGAFDYIAVIRLDRIHRFRDKLKLRLRTLTKYGVKVLVAGDDWLITR